MCLLRAEKAVWMESWVLGFWDPEEGPQTTTLPEQHLKKTAQHVMRPQRPPRQLRTRSRSPVSGRVTQARLEGRGAMRDLITPPHTHQVSSHCGSEREEMSQLKGAEL